MQSILLSPLQLTKHAPPTGGIWPLGHQIDTVRSLRIYIINCGENVKRMLTPLRRRSDQNSIAFSCISDLGKNHGCQKGQTFNSQLLNEPFPRYLFLCCMNLLVKLISILTLVIRSHFETNEKDNLLCIVKHRNLPNRQPESGDEVKIISMVYKLNRRVTGSGVRLNM